MADPEGRLITLYDVKTPVVTFAKRTTFVIGKDRRITSVTTGGDAVDPKQAVDSASMACGL